MAPIYFTYTVAGVTVVRRYDEQSAEAAREGKALAKVILDKKTAVNGSLEECLPIRALRQLFASQAARAV